MEQPKVRGLPENWGILKEVVFERDGYECVRCDATLCLTVHHIKPREKGGSDDLTNLVTLCNICHDIVELDPFELFVKVKSRKAQEVYYNKRRGEFGKRIVPLVKGSIRRRSKRKLSARQLYLKGHPLTEREKYLMDTSSSFKNWLRREIYNHQGAQ